MTKRPNILFIMVDQMRADCLSCEGHPVIKTPNLDALALRGVRFSHAFVQSAVCVPSRMSFYTGRYLHSHRSSWNNVPLSSSEKTMGHYVSDAGYRAAQCGRAHYYADTDDVWISDPRKVEQLSATLPGLEEWLSHETYTSEAYRAHLTAKGYPEDVCRYPTVPRMVSGHNLDSDPSAIPVDVREEDSDTAFVTDKAIEFLNQPHEHPWFLFLSYWKPHPPFFAPSPYHKLYDLDSIPEPNRIDSELENPHPLINEYRHEFNGERFDDEKNWRQVRATYYGLITEIDYHIGRVIDSLRATGQEENTVIFFTSDHGEYLGDHWLHNKEMFYDTAYRVPWIWFDPRPEADSTRGMICDAFVECIDALPTMLETVGVSPTPAIQGRSLLPWIFGDKPDRWRTAVYADWDFRCYQMGANLNLNPDQCRGWMVRDRNIKYWHLNGLPDVLFDLQNDPLELHNRADDPEYEDVVQKYLLKLIDWRMSTEDPSRISWTYRMTEHRRSPDRHFWD